MIRLIWGVMVSVFTGISLILIISLVETSADAASKRGKVSVAFKDPVDKVIVTDDKICYTHKDEIVCCDVKTKTCGIVE